MKYIHDICIHVGMYVCIIICMYVYIHVCIDVCTCMYMYMYIILCMYGMYVCMYCLYCHMLYKLGETYQDLLQKPPEPTHAFDLVNMKYLTLLV